MSDTKTTWARPEYGTLYETAPTWEKVNPFGHGEGSHPKYRENMTKAMGTTKSGLRFNADATLCCCYCGRYTGTGRLYVYLLSTSEFSESEHFKGDDGDNLCMYPVGSDCAKKLKAHGVPLYRYVPAPDGGWGDFARVNPKK